MQILPQTELDFSDVLIKPRRSTICSRKDANIVREYKFKWFKRTVKGTGIMNANMGTIGNFNVAKAMLDDGLFTCLHKHHKKENLFDFYKTLKTNPDSFFRCFLSIGLKDNGLEKIEYLYKHLDEVPPICIDVPNGYIPQVKELVMKIREKYPDCLLMVGNVVTGDIVEDLILSGADVLKSGLGSGGQCRTRAITGVGRPQFSAVVECADAAHQVGGMVCSDGGITCPGDISKAFGAGADLVMIGSLYAGTDEADGEIIYEEEFTNTYSPDYYLNTETGEICSEQVNGNEQPVFFVISHRKKILRKYKKFYGMSSTLAQETFGNGKPNYRASEGRVSLVPYSGSVKDVNEEFLGGLRSTMTYIGASKLKDIPKCCVFYRVNNQLNRSYEQTTIGK